MSRNLKPCGTIAAYVRHRANGEYPCQPCREANSAYHAQYRNGSAKPRIPQPCGTNAAYQQHVLRHEDACQPCLDAHNAYMRAWKRQQRQEQREAREMAR